VEENRIADAMDRLACHAFPPAKPAYPPKVNPAVLAAIDRKFFGAA